MPLVSDASESNIQNKNLSQKRSFITPLLRLPRNVYILLIFTTGKGFQLSISTLTLNYYVHSLGYQPEFIGVFSAMPAIGALISAVPVGFLADRIGRKPVLVFTAILTPVFLAACALVTSVKGCLLLAPSLLLTFFGRLLKQPRAVESQKGK